MKLINNENLTVFNYWQLHADLPKEVKKLIQEYTVWDIIYEDINEYLYDVLVGNENVKKTFYKSQIEKWWDEVKIKEDMDKLLNTMNEKMHDEEGQYEWVLYITKEEILNGYHIVMTNGYGKTAGEFHVGRFGDGEIIKFIS